MPQRNKITPFQRLDGQATFDEPWQAQVLAMAQNLVDAGRFTAAEWSDALGAALRETQVDAASDTPENYYQAALIALEALIVHSGIRKAEIAEVKQGWIDAYETTPHGQPVRLNR